MVCTYPRIILAEINTHRMLSRSTASSRAIPIHKQIEKVKTRPFIPSWIGASQSGMQANNEVDENDQRDFKGSWLELSVMACNTARYLDNLGIHKQIVNRVLEPWGYVTSIFTATEWDNLYKLRCHKDAQPEFQALAYKMLEAHAQSVPLRSDLHIPFGDKMEHGLSEEDKIKIACARCARISYENHDGNKDSADDLRLYEQLKKSGHMSPFEHVAKANINDTFVGNFQGWIQHRKMILNENIVKIDRDMLLANKPRWI